MSVTVEEAKTLNKGDFVLYNNLKYKVSSVKECRNSHTNEIYINIKCCRRNETIWLSNKFANRF